MPWRQHWMSPRNPQSLGFTAWGLGPQDPLQLRGCSWRSCFRVLTGTSLLVPVAVGVGARDRAAPGLWPSHPVHSTGPGGWPGWRGVVLAGHWRVGVGCSAVVVHRKYWKGRWTRPQERAALCEGGMCEVRMCLK